LFARFVISSLPATESARISPSELKSLSQALLRLSSSLSENEVEDDEADDEDDDDDEVVVAAFSL
jgi:hypothetical protein